VKRILVEIGAGELLDRMTIVEIKTRHAAPDAQQRLRSELENLRSSAAEAGLLVRELETELSDLRATNEALWRIEDEIRCCEAERDFGRHFVDLARAIYTKNDHRSRIKRRIDERCGSSVLEEKVYGAPEPSR
jgi:hypothetical protein